MFDQVLSQAVITDKDRNGLSLEDWTADERSRNFLYETLMEHQEIIVVWALKSLMHNTREHGELDGFCWFHLQHHEINNQSNSIDHDNNFKDYSFDEF